MIDKNYKNFKTYLKDKYSAYVEKQEDGSFYVYIFDGIYKCKEIYNLKNMLKKYEKVLCFLQQYEERLESTYIKDNKIWMTIKTKEGVVRDTTILGYNKMLRSRINFENEVKKNGHTLLTTYIDAKKKVLIDFNCGHKPHYLNPNSYLKGTRCPICCNKKIEPYVNDCYTLRPDLLKYFLDKNEAVGIAVGDKTKRSFICPRCGCIKQDTASNIANFGFSCPRCSDGISFPNKMMNNVLSSIGIQFEREKHFDWCVYADENGQETDGYYDFFIPSKNLFIEMDGSIHYKGGFNNNAEDVIFRDTQKNILAAKYGYDVVRIDCNYKKTNRFNYIKNEIIKSLNHIFDLSTIDWKDINITSSCSLKILSINMWNKNQLIGVAEIAEKLNINKATVMGYLKQGYVEGLCNYSEEERYRRKTERLHNKFNIYVKVLKGSDIIGVFFDFYQFVDNFNKYYGKEILKKRRQSILDVVRGKRKTYKGFVFIEIDKDEYDILIKNNSLINDINIGGESNE